MAASTPTRLEAEQSLGELEEELSDNNVIHRALTVAMAFTEQQRRNVIDPEGPHFLYSFDGEQDVRRDSDELEIRLEAVNLMPRELVVRYEGEIVLDAHRPGEVIDLAEDSPRPRQEEPEWYELSTRTEVPEPDEEMDLYLPETDYIVETYRRGPWTDEIDELYSQATGRINEEELGELAENFGIDF